MKEGHDAFLLDVARDGVPRAASYVLHDPNKFE